MNSRSMTLCFRKGARVPENSIQVPVVSRSGQVVENVCFPKMQFHNVSIRACYIHIDDAP
jgi:hypothetical protein